MIILSDMAYDLSNRLQYLTKVSTPLTFQQKCKYNFSRDNTAQIKLGYIL